jgi:hypothetical protein
MRASLLTLLLGLSLNAQAYQVRDAFEADQMCSGVYSCDRETFQEIRRYAQPVVQPASPAPVKGNCSILPRGLDYGARPNLLSCGGGTDQRLRERIAHTQEELDNHMGYLDSGNRAAAQKVLLKKDYGWAHNIKFNVTENWTYKKKVGDYIDCRGYPTYSEGGEPERYETTCYRKGRKERVVQRVIRYNKYCAKATPPPPPPQVDTTPAPSYNGGNYNSGGSSSGSRSYERQEPRQQQQPKRDNIQRGRDEDEDAIRRRMERAEKKRKPARSLRRLQDDSRTDQDSTPTYGCDEWRTKKVKDEDVELWVDADDLSYSCTKVRSKWCTWFVDDSVMP